jgi:hypothetical protein
MANKDLIFNPRKRTLRRTRISAKEAWFGACFLALLALIAGWYASKRNDFNPADRDIKTETLAADTVKDDLYRTPAQRWVDPAKAQAAGAAAAGPDLGVFPAAILEGGWQPESRAESFDPDRLFEKIDGGAEQYIAYGFKRMHFVYLKSADAKLELSIELYDMDAFENALGIFAAQRNKDHKVEKNGDAYFYEINPGAIGLAGKYYFKMSANEENPALQEKARQLVTALAGLGGQAAIPKTCALLMDTLKIPFDGVAYERENAFQYNFAKAFWFGKPDPAADLRYYVHEAASADEAKALFDKLLENHLQDYNQIERKGNAVVLQHKYLNTFLTLNLNQTLVYGVDAAPDRAAADQALQTLAGAVTHG